MGDREGEIRRRKEGLQAKQPAAGAAQPPQRPWPRSAACARLGSGLRADEGLQSQGPTESPGSPPFTLFLLTALRNKPEMRFSAWKHRGPERFQRPSRAMNGAVTGNKDWSSGCHCSFSSATRSNHVPFGNRPTPAPPSPQALRPRTDQPETRLFPPPPTLFPKLPCGSEEPRD